MNCVLEFINAARYEAAAIPTAGRAAGRQQWARASAMVVVIPATAMVMMAEVVTVAAEAVVVMIATVVVPR